MFVAIWRAISTPTLTKMVFCSEGMWRDSGRATVFAASIIPPIPASSAQKKAITTVMFLVTHGIQTSMPLLASYVREE